LVVKTNAAQALVMVSKNRNFDQKSKANLLAIYRDAILGGDPGVIAIITAALVDPTSDFKNMGVDFGFLKEAKNKLVLPKDIEALQPLEVAIAYFEGKEKPKAPQNQFNHPIDWKLVKTIKKNQRVKIETTKGAIVLTLLVEEAPGSVANFVELVSKKYFNDKFFHRVVPNFVIQTGCNRGDGFGSEDYSIRSEFSTRRYKEGSVGMASAGKDTEGTQWFITHSPTPHLNGRYTIFAEVTEGMEVVQAIQVGDQIKTISLL
jgi:cyclophilin family peptidyl-prolyl cis-trans isomerase